MNPIDFSICNEVFEKFGERRLIGRGEYFARSGEVMEYAGWIVSGGFKYSLMSSEGNNRIIGFSLDDSLLIDYESVMHSTKMRTDIIALEDSEVIIIPAKIMCERLNCDHELNMHLIFVEVHIAILHSGKCTTLHYIADRCANEMLLSYIFGQKCTEADRIKK